MLGGQGGIRGWDVGKEGLDLLWSTDYFLIPRTTSLRKEMMFRGPHRAAERSGRPVTICIVVALTTTAAACNVLRETDSGGDGEVGWRRVVLQYVFLATACAGNLARRTKVLRQVRSRESERINRSSRSHTRRHQTESQNNPSGGFSFHVSTRYEVWMWTGTIRKMRTDMPTNNKNGHHQPSIEIVHLHPCPSIPDHLACYAQRTYDMPKRTGVSACFTGPAEETV